MDEIFTQAELIRLRQVGDRIARTIATAVGKPKGFIIDKERLQRLFQ